MTTWSYGPKASMLTVVAADIEQEYRDRSKTAGLDHLEGRPIYGITWTRMEEPGPARQLAKMTDPEYVQHVWANILPIVGKWKERK